MFSLDIGAVPPVLGVITGQVTAAAGAVSGAPVTVTTSGGFQAGQTMTSGTGSYTIGGLPPGTYNVQASGTELQPQTKPAVVTSDQTTTVDFALAPLVRPTPLDRYRTGLGSDPMCVNCISSSEAYLAQVALVVSVLKTPLHRVLADAGLVAPPDFARRDLRTVAFLRSLDLDPAEILGEDVVERAEAWTPKAHVRSRRWARPIGSQRRLAAQ